MYTKYKIVPFCSYHFVQYHFVHTFLSVPFCPYHFVRSPNETPQNITDISYTSGTQPQRNLAGHVFDLGVSIEFRHFLCISGSQDSKGFILWPQPEKKP